jgi:hypothetical protein
MLVYTCERGETVCRKAQQHRCSAAAVNDTATTDGLHPGQEDLGNASEDQCRLTEQMRLATMRATAASESARAMEEALAGARREADAAREQVRRGTRQRSCEAVLVSRVGVSLPGLLVLLNRWIWRRLLHAACPPALLGLLRASSFCNDDAVLAPCCSFASQLASLRRREMEASAAQARLQMALEQARGELSRCGACSVRLLGNTCAALRACMPGLPLT